MLRVQPQVSPTARFYKYKPTSYGLSLDFRTKRGFDLLNIVQNKFLFVYGTGFVKIRTISAEHPLC